MTDAVLETDYLIVGGGSAGAIVARRLADAGIGRVLLIEAGPSDEDTPVMNDLSRLDDQGDHSDWGFMAAPLAGGPAELPYPRAKVLGGCGNHNDCAFLEPPASDLDGWAASGADGWDAAELKPYARRVREMAHVERDPPLSPVSQTFVRAARELGLAALDPDADVSEGVGAFPLNALGALRQSSSIAYLHPISDLPDTLEVWTETRVSRVIVENGRTVACETSRGRVDVHAEVILAAGAIQTPQLMMVSGLGPADQLKGHGIDVVADLPGVGGNLNDHVAAAVVFDLHEAPPPWQLTAFEAVMLKTVDADAPAPDLLYHFGLTVREKYGLHPRLGNPRHGVKLSPNVTRARSRGSVTLAGGDIEDAPKIDLNYFSDPQGYDMRILLAGTKFARRLIEAPSFAEIVRAETAPGPEVQTDGELEAYIRSVCETVYHPCGTCRMGTDDQAVVTPDLKVRGVDGLSVVDASVFPSIVTVNINFAVMMVAEKAADTILARA